VRHFLSLAAAFSLIILAGWSHAQASARVELFSPSGTVKGVRQVAARFSEPMTTFGDPRNESPFDISCPEKGAGRWADVTNWIFDFDRDLPAGIACSFTLRDGLKTLAGSAVAGERAFSFSTGGPAIVGSRPGDGATVDEGQIFLLSLDGAPDETTVLANVRFSVQAVAETLGIQIVKGAERSAVLKAAGRTDTPRILAIRCRQNFPSKAAVKLIWGAGVRSVTGVPTTADQVIDFTVRDQFTVSFQCERTKANAPCIPMTPMMLHFSSPVPALLARQIVMKSGKKVYRPGLATDEDEDGVPTDGDLTGIRFPGPFPEKKSFVIELPKGLTDDAGRPVANKAKFPLHVTTDAFPPLAKFAAPFGIVELNGESAIPVTLRNLEPRVKARRLNPDEPPKPAEKLKDNNDSKDNRHSKEIGDLKNLKDVREAVIQKAHAVSQRLSSWLSGSQPKREKPVQPLKVKQQIIPSNREEKIIEWLRKVRVARRNKPLLKGAGAEDFVIPKPGGDKAFEVVGIPVKKAGFHIVELESPILGAALLEKHRPMYVSSAVLVTNMSAHFKWGRESSLVWVTSLDQGMPVAGAEVNIRDCKGKLHWQGKTDADGIARVRAKLSHKLPYCSDNSATEQEEDDYSDNDAPMLQGMGSGLFVFARKSDDLTFVHSSWDRGIENWRFNLPGDEFTEHTVAHTVFDRTLVRAGDILHMKHFMRNLAMKGFDLRKVSELPQAVVVKHRGSGQHYEFPLAWRADNSSETTMVLPRSAELGYYDVYLAKQLTVKGNKGDAAREEDGEGANFYVDGWQSGSFRLEEFRVPLMKGVVEPPKEAAVQASSVEVDLYVSHLSGGGAGGAAVKLRSQIKPRSVSFNDYEDYSFANGKVAAGVVKEEAYERSRDDEEDQDAATQEAQPEKPSYRSQDLVLDKTGALRARVGDLPQISAPHLLIAELEFRDPNGEIQTVTGRVPLWSSQLLVGIKPDSWSSSGEALNFKTVVLDVRGKPVPGAKVAVELFSRKIYSHRKRLVGGFYSYEHVTETKSAGPLCSGTTDEKGVLDCSAKSPVSGNVILQATVSDQAGNSSSSNRDVWVAGQGEWWFEAGDSDRIDLLPERKAYNPGESAKFQVRAPFRSATVLVTVEREGILDAYVKKLSGKDPVVSVPVKSNYAPNVFVSALCVRGRSAGTKPTALFDPGKPTYRLGMSEIRVGRKAHELKVQLTADRTTYKVRGKAQISIKVARADGGALPKDAEVAVAAVDEGLLELMPNDSWKLLDVMMGRRGHEIETSTAQSQVVGRRHFGLKALPAGGGGGVRSARELFDTLLTWKGRVKLDSRGEATLEIPLNDSLTSFTVVAVASAGTGLFGTGRTTIRTTQELMVLPGLPPLVRQGDRFSALFTVRNASNREMSLAASARPSWSTGAGFAPIPLKLAPGEAKELSWPAQVPAGIDSAIWEAQVKEEEGEAFDKVKVTQRVSAAVPLQVYQATIAQVDKSFALEVRMPGDAIKGRGGVNVALRPRLADGLGGVVQFMKSYPYSCMEQSVSRAVSLKDHALWKQVVTKLPAHLDANGLVKYFPSPWLEGSPVLTAYILSITKESGLELPDHLILQMEKGLVAFIEGKLRRESSFKTADLSIQKLTALEALSQRGGASAKLLSSIALEPNLWPTSALLDWFSILKRTGEIPERTRRLKEAEQIIRSRLNLQGTTMNFSTEGSDRLWWLMVSTDTNALRALIALLDQENWRPEIPRLVRGALARQTHGSWDTTIANAWGVVALDRFSRKFEATPVTGSVRAELAGAAKSLDWGSDKKGKTLSFAWPEAPAKLTLQQNGTGKPWASIMSLAALPLKEALSSGYHIKRSVAPVEQRVKGRWNRGDVARVRLEIEAQSDMTWVAVSDPVPGGTTILGSGLGRDSALVTEGEKNRSWPVFEERAQEAYRAYYDYLPKGKLVLEYTVRFNNEGKFHLPPTRVEALYAPEMFGELPNQTLSVGE